LNRNYGNSLDNLIHSFFDAKIADMKLRKLEPEVLHKLVHFKWFLYKPKVIVFVKPFSEVDIHLQEITLEMIRKIKAIGIAVIILIANFSELNKIEGETIFIKGGKSIDENEVYQILYGNR
jgi:ribose transport system ATP-binding protein